MCTLTYIPLQNKGFILTTNRDESGLRPAEAPLHYEHESGVLLYPRDLEASGTWMASNGSDTTICLLNGAYQKHKREKSYRKSRGVMALEYFGYAQTLDFIREYRFDGIEPFTLVIVKHEPHLNLEELRWDGSNIHYRCLPEERPRLWSSATLYPQSIWEERASWFRDWLAKKPEVNLKSILKFHHNGGAGDDWNGLIMNRNGKVMTVSITSIQWNGIQLDMYYEDLLKDKQFLRRYGQDDAISSPFHCTLD